MVLEMNVLNGIFYKRKMFQPKYHCVEINYLGVIQNRRGRLLCLHDNAFSQYTPAFVSVIVACRRELERLSELENLFNIYSNIFVNIRNVQILNLSRKIHSLEISYLHKMKVEI